MTSPGTRPAETSNAERTTRFALTGGIAFLITLLLSTVGTLAETEPCGGCEPDASWIKAGFWVQLVLLATTIMTVLAGVRRPARRGTATVIFIAVLIVSIVSYTAAILLTMHSFHS